MNGRRWLGTMAGAGAGAALLLVAVLVLGTGPGEAPAAVEAIQPEGADPERVSIIVEGMACPLCTAALERRMEDEIPGLEELEIELEGGEVTFRLADGSEVPDEAIRETVENAGFVLKELDRRPE